MLLFLQLCVPAVFFSSGRTPRSQHQGLLLLKSEMKMPLPWAGISKGINQHSFCLHHMGDMPVPLVIDLPLQAHTPSALQSDILDSEREDTKMLSEVMSTTWHGCIYLAVLDKLQVAGEKVMSSGSKNL